MKGKNAILKPLADQSGESLQVHSVFDTIQGEGPWTGFPATFVRLHGCNLACYFCDTEFEQSRYEWGTKILADNMHARGARRVVITGGEPLRQNISLFVELLNDRGIAAQVETAGTLFPAYYTMSYLFAKRNKWGNLLVCSPKTSKIHDDIAELCWDYKYVIRAGETDAEDGLPIMSTQIEGKRKRIARPPLHARIWVLPMDEGDDDRNALNMNDAARVAMAHNYRLTIQVHKILNLP